jgi:hypothetical protein
VIGFAGHAAVVPYVMAGAKRRQKLEFLKKHPKCCFCGGEADTTEWDHIPARHLFAERNWPEGYVFPACGACNDASASDELIMGFLVRIQVTDLSETEERELHESISKMHDRHPDIINGMREMSRNETKRSLRENGFLSVSLPKPLYMVEFPDSIIEVSERYGRKLGKALYYMHTGAIFPANGRVFCEVMSNIRFMSRDFPLDAFHMLSASPTISRGGKSLADQFAYRWGMTPEKDAAAFLIQFGESTAMLVITYTDVEKYEKVFAARSAAKVG